MWVKTDDGRLLNLHHSQVVYYIAPKDITVTCDVDGDGYVVLAHGNAMTTIANAIDLGYNLLEVGSDGD